MTPSSPSELHRRKRELRREIRRKLELLTPATKAAAAADLCKRLVADPKINEARWLAAFMALNNEPDLSAFLEARLRRGLPLLLPKIVGDPKNGNMELRVVRHWGTDFSEGPMGIIEPGAHCPVYAATGLPGGGHAVDVALVPGVAFDRDGHRMGRGAGHYDRFLAQAQVNWRVGIGFACQRVEAVPVEAHDIALDAVLLA